jgi:hypothetical protein
MAMPGGQWPGPGRAHRCDRRGGRGRAGPTCSRAVRSYRCLGQQRRCLPARPAGGDSARRLLASALHPKRERIVGAPAAWSPWRKWFPRAGSSGSTAAISTGLQFAAEPAPATDATCTRPSRTAALRLAAAGGAGPTRRLSSAGWPRLDCWLPPQSPSPGSPPAPAGPDRGATAIACAPPHPPVSWMIPAG